jgi:FixJ family two-component response regulator
MPTHKHQLVVIVDDDAGVREATESLLNSAGFATACYESAEAFLGARLGRKARCLVLDLHLPGMSGLELYAAIRAEGLGTPVILLTATHDPGGELLAGALSAGIAGVLYKPFDGDALVSLVQAAIDRPMP